MSAKTVEAMMNSAKEYADMLNYNYVSDDTWLQWINRGISDLWDMLQDARGAEYYSKQGEIQLVSGTENYQLSSDTLYVLTMFLKLGESDYREIDKFEFADEPELRSRSYSNGFLRYHIVGSTDPGNSHATVKFLPIPRSSDKVVYRYVQKPPVFGIADLASSFDGISGWEEYAELLAARKAISKMNMDTRNVDADIARVAKKIMRMRSQRDGHRPPRIKDTRRDHSVSFYWGKW